MTSRFERDFYKASIFQASIDSLKELGVENPTTCQALQLIKIERREARKLPPRIAPIDEKAKLIRASEIRNILGKPKDYQLSNREFQKGLTTYKKDLKRRGLVLRPILETPR